MSSDESPGVPVIKTAVSAASPREPISDTERISGTEQISDKERYSRQILFPPIGEAGQQKISKARVAIVGCEAGAH